MPNPEEPPFLIRQQLLPPWTADGGGFTSRLLRSLPTDIGRSVPVHSAPYGKSTLILPIIQFGTQRDLGATR